MINNAVMSSSSGEDLIPIIQPNFNNHNFSVIENTKHNRVELHLRGEFPSPEKVGDELSTLCAYAEEYNTCLVYINSPGGSLNTVVELLAVMDKFDNVITVGCGEVSSAGFFLWCRGHTRVVHPFTSFMAHREAYGHGGKTDQHVDYAAHINRIGARLIEHTCGDVLSPEELERCKYTEVFFSDEDLLEREVCIPWDQFVEADTTPIEWNVYFEKDGVMYFPASESHVTFEMDDKVYLTRLHDVIYDIPGRLVIEVEDATEEEEETGS